MPASTNPRECLSPDLARVFFACPKFLLKHLILQHRSSLDISLSTAVPSLQSPNHEFTQPPRTSITWHRRRLGGRRSRPPYQLRRVSPSPPGATHNRRGTPPRRTLFRRLRRSPCPHRGRKANHFDRQDRSRRNHRRSERIRPRHRQRVCHLQGILPNLESQPLRHRCIRHRIPRSRLPPPLRDHQLHEPTDPPHERTLGRSRVPRQRRALVALKAATP